jgi:hypothetical protein
MDMRALGIMAFLVASLTVLLRADTYEVSKTTVDGHETVFAHYIQGKNIRTEHFNGNEVQLVTIRNTERNTGYMLDLSTRKYVELSPQNLDLIVLLAQWIARPPRARESGKTVNIYYETTDTGERKQYFGRTAKHLLLRERHVAEPGACEQTYDTQKEGWYIPPTEPNTVKGPYLTVSFVITGAYSRCHDTVVVHGNPPPPGVPVWETYGNVMREILELSHSPLDKGLFEVPSGFQKVESLPAYQPVAWSRRLQMEWAQLERAFESWFE